MTLRRMIAALCLTLVPAAPALAQALNPRAGVARPVMTAWADATSPAPPRDGAYERLSAGNQKIASAIFEAQKTDGTDNLTLDQIAALKGSGQGGWARVYKDMQARGLVTEKSLGQALTRYAVRAK